jgi:hypothetical protein
MNHINYEINQQSLTKIATVEATVQGAEYLTAQ